ncbi:hypothetical protein PAPHI01_0840 [Pancytospora philotis]|nr:hypothetical protein PAPHI01_0840 [Pancytospora philotis]
MEKEIEAEFPLVLAEGQTELALWRLPGQAGSIAPTEILYKPLAGHIELAAPLPNRNVSALRCKMLSVAQLTYKATGTPTTNCYATELVDGRLLLRRIGATYLFSATHPSYGVSAQEVAMKKAESREELEHRKKSINYKLKLLESEEPRQLRFEDASHLHKNCLVVEKSEEEKDGEEGRTDKEAAVASTLATSTERMSRMAVSGARAEFSPERVEEVIRNARIANYADLVAIFGNENAVKNVFYKMTEKIAGRFVLKNAYYEKSLWKRRSALLELFKERDGEVQLSQLQFLGEELWMATELSEQAGDRYVLKGRRESTSFDMKEIEACNRQTIGAAMADGRMLAAEEIAQLTGFDEEVVHRYVNGSEYLHLANNAYVRNDDQHWFHPVLVAFTGRRSLSLAEAGQLLSDSPAEHSEEEIAAALRLYCNQRGGKYFLKILK